MAAAVPMMLFMAVAAATWVHQGFYSPFYTVAAILDPTALQISVQEAATGSPFWLEVQSALPGLCVMLAVAGFFGALFALVVRARPNAKPAVLVALGAAWGLLLALLMGLVLLPLAARVLGGGDVIAELPANVGWGTFVVQCLIYGLGLGGLAAWRATRPAPPAEG